MGEVSFYLIGTNSFHIKAENENLLLCGLALSSEPKIWKFLVVVCQTTSKKSRKRGAARAARLLFPNQPIISLICGFLKPPNKQYKIPYHCTPTITDRFYNLCRISRLDIAWKSRRLPSLRYTLLLSGQPPSRGKKIRHFFIICVATAIWKNCYVNCACGNIQRCFFNTFAQSVNLINSIHLNMVYGAWRGQPWKKASNTKKKRNCWISLWKWISTTSLPRLFRRRGRIPLGTRWIFSSSPNRELNPRPSDHCVGCSSNGDGFGDASIVRGNNFSSENKELKQHRQQRQRKCHLKINIWEIVVILRLLLLPNILYCWQSTL